MICISPILVIIFTSIFVLLLDAFLPNGDKKLLAIITGLGLVIAGATSYLLWEAQPQSLFHQALRIDQFSIFFNFIFLFLTGFTLVSALPKFDSQHPFPGEFFFFLLAACSGMMLMASASDLITFFISLEIMSLALYVLTGLYKQRIQSVEASLKYFLLGAFSTGFLLLGIVFIYAATHTTSFAAIGHYLITSEHVLPPIFMLGVGLLLTGFAFKVGAVPFHMWVPDVYEGAPTVITGYMATAVKAAGFAVLIRFFLVTLLPILNSFSTVMITITILTMTVGNLAALTQNNIKRMLAYSSIAHAGYILIAICSANSQSFNLSIGAVVFYLVAYGMMTFGAFIVLSAVSTHKHIHTLKDVIGLGFKNPWLGASFSVFLLSLTGIPLTAGFIGKFYIFSTALKAGFYGLAFIGILNSLLAATYYLRVIVYMYMKDEENVLEKQTPEFAWHVVIGILAFATLYFGIFPTPILNFIEKAVLALF